MTAVKSIGFDVCLGKGNFLHDFLNWGDVKELGPNPKLNVSLVNVARKGFKKSVARLLEARSDPNMILEVFSRKNHRFMLGVQYKPSLSTVSG